MSDKPIPVSGPVAESQATPTESQATPCGCGKIHHHAVVHAAVITLSDTRTMTEDRSGNRIIELLEQAGHHLASRWVLTDDAAPLRDKVRTLTLDPSVDAIITTGGTGIAPRDLAIDVIEDLLDVRLPGFGEYFRALSIAEIGPKAMLSRATAGRIGETVLFALPGSTGAVTTAMTHCVLPILTHAVSLARDRDGNHAAHETPDPLRPS